MRVVVLCFIARPHALFLRMSRHFLPLKTTTTPTPTPLPSTSPHCFFQSTAKMLPVPADALLPEGVTALEIPSDSDRPATVCHFKGPEVPVAATAVSSLAHVPFPDSGVKLYFNGDPDSPGVHYARRVAYACITPPCRADDPGPFIRLVFRTLALDLPQNFELLPPAPACRGIHVLFRTPRDREAAARRQPFRLDGATVRFVPVQTVLDVSGGYMAHVALYGYPVEQRTMAHATDNCCRFGVVREIDPACVGAPELSVLRVVLQLEHPREIPRELRVYYRDGSASAVPVQIVGVWECSHSYDVDGEYVPLFKTPAAMSNNDVVEVPLVLAGLAEYN